MTPVYTSYFGNMRNLPKDRTCFIAISQTVPKGIKVNEHWKELAPSYDILNEYKAAGDIELFTKRYNAEVLNISTKEKMYFYTKALLDLATKYPNGVFLLCYEKPSEFCHRHLFARYINVWNGAVIKEWEK